MRFLCGLLFVCLLLMAGCNAQQPETVVKPVDDQSTPSASLESQQDDTLIDAVILEFIEREAGIDPYPVRMLITKNHLRMDEGSDNDNFLLFDRNSKDIFSVTHYNQQILKIPNRQHLLQTTDSIEFSRQENSTEGIPEFAGKQPRHMRFTANGKTCYEVIAVENVQEDAVAAIRGYLLTLAADQIINLNKTAVEFRTDCMLSNLIYEPVKHLDYGLPLREWDYKGYVRELTNYHADSKVDSNLFEIDPDYQVFQVGVEGPTASP